MCSETAPPPLCPKSDPSTAKQIDGTERHLLFDRCNSWDCPFCSLRKISALAARIKEANPERFVTLTTRATDNGSPDEEHKRLSKQIPKLIRKMDAKREPKTQYFRVLELTKRGWPHYHFLTKGPFWNQRELSHVWKSLSGAHIVDIRRVTGNHHLNYVTKYIQKGLPIEWARRRFSASKNFFEPKPPKPKPTYCDFDRPFQLESWQLVQRWYRLGSRPVSKTIFQPHENDHPKSLFWWLYREENDDT